MSSLLLAPAAVTCRHCYRLQFLLHVVSDTCSRCFCYLSFLIPTPAPVTCHLWFLLLLLLPVVFDTCSCYLIPALVSLSSLIPALVTCCLYIPTPAAVTCRLWYPLLLPVVSNTDPAPVTCHLWFLLLLLLPVVFDTCSCYLIPALVFLSSLIPALVTCCL